MTKVSIHYADQFYYDLVKNERHCPSSLVMLFRPKLLLPTSISEERLYCLCPSRNDTTVVGLIDKNHKNLQ